MTANKWKTMETLPKEECFVLVQLGGIDHVLGRIATARVSNGRVWSIGSNFASDRPYPAVRWMELPELDETAEFLTDERAWGK